jgi:multidrug efflux pump subunit AcrA (membrane-fusion protein)
MLAEISLEKSDSLSGVVLPTSAVLLDEKNQKFVWVVSKGLAERRDVEVLLNIDAVGNDVLVQGVEPGDTVIVGGMQKVGRGTRVEGQ